MDTRQEPDRSLLLTYDSTRWTKWLIGAALLLLGTAVYDYFVGSRGDDRLIGLLGAATTLAVIGLVMLEQARFRVDPLTRLIEWDQRWAFRHRAGIIRFDDAKHVSVEVPIGDRGIPQAVTIHTSVMEFDLDQGTAVLTRTPAVLSALLSGLSPEWAEATEGPDTWSPYVVVGHLIHGERTDWIPRAQIILAQGASVRFTPYDRFAQFHESEGKRLEELLDEFATLRAANLATLRGWRLDDAKLSLPGEHPAFGAVTLRQLLATWVAHDPGHLVQIARVMAKQYRGAVGPWHAYLSVMGP